MVQRGRKATKWTYMLRGRVRCGYCGRRMEGTPRGSRIYYRCAARSIVPGSPVLDHHPKNVYLPEQAVIGVLNTWISGLFDADHRKATVRRMLDTDTTSADTARHEQARAKVNAAETRLRRLQAAIEAGAEPDALVDAINRAKEERDTARNEIRRIPAGKITSWAQIDAMLDYIGDVGHILNRAKPTELQDLYTALRLEMTYQPEQWLIEATIRPSSRGNECVRGRTCTLTTRLLLCGVPCD